MCNEDRKPSKDKEDRDLDGNEDHIDSDEDSSSTGSLISLNFEELDKAYAEKWLESSGIYTEEMPKDVCFRHSSLNGIECFTENILDEYPNDGNEDRPFKSSKNMASQQNTKILSMNQLEENKEIFVEKDSRGLKEDTNDSNNKTVKADVTYDIKAGVSEEVSDVVKNCCTPISENINMWSKPNKETLVLDDKAQNIRFTDCPTDEFKVVADNIKESLLDNSQIKIEDSNGQASSSYTETGEKSSNKYFHKFKFIIPGKLIHKHMVESLSSREFDHTEKPTSSGFSETKTRNIISDENQKAAREISNKFRKGKICPEIHAGIKTSKNEEKKKVIKQITRMSIIPKITEPEEDSKIKTRKDSQPTISKINPLKSKTKIFTTKYRCGVCNVRLGLCAIRCRCENYYCAKHRYDKEHNCTFDYKGMGAKEISKNNPRVVGEKVRKL